MIRGAVIALIFLFVGVAGAAAVFEYMPNAGSAPSIFDDFKWNSTANGFWHVNATGATATVKDSLLTLKGDTIELDRRVQTDPYSTVLLAKVRARQFDKFDIGIGAYHAGTITLEFDADGVKCGWGSDLGWEIGIMKQWSPPPFNQWYYLRMDVGNPYPNVPNPVLAKIPPEKLKPVNMRCSVYDSAGHLIATEVPKDPPPNAHYVSLDEAFLRTWDSHNDYQIDWYYVGPPSGIPHSFP